jgi:RimJ/RimL family protein N-acetyltransferase
MVLHFAFFRIRLHKLYSYVYEDNPEAAQATLRLGFKEEGRLRDHFRFEQGYVSVTVFGLTVDQLLANSALVKTIERRLGFKVKVG